MATRETLVAQSEALTKMLIDGRFDDVWAQFGNRMAVALPVEALARSWREVQKKLGGAAEPRLGPPAVTVTVPIAGEAYTVKVDISWDDADRVVGLYFRWS
jgi:hypothetical protein